MLAFSPLAVASLASTGTGTLLAALAATEAQDTAAVNVEISSTLSLASTEAQDVASFIMAKGDYIAYLAATEAQDTASFAAIASNGMVLAATEAPDVAAVDVAIIGFCNLQASEDLDTAAFTANNQNIYFDLTEAPDIAAFAINMSGTMALAVTETPDSYAQNAYILWLEPDQPDDPTIWVPKNDPAPYLTTVI